MKRIDYSQVVFFVVLLIPILTSFAGTPARTVAHYNVTSRGFAIGEVTTTQRAFEEGGIASVNFETRTAVKASFLWMGYQLDTLEKGRLQKGELISYSRKGSENGDSIDVEGRFEQASFRFNVRERGTTRSIVVPRSSYDYTTMECPEARLDFAGQTQTFRILDVENMAVVKRDYRLVRSTTYVVGDKELPCRIVDFSDQNKAARRWIAWDGSAVVMYRQDSRGGKNSYSVKAASVSKEM